METQPRLRLECGESSSSSRGGTVASGGAGAGKTLYHYTIPALAWLHTACTLHIQHSNYRVCVGEEGAPPSHSEGLSLQANTSQFVAHPVCLVRPGVGRGGSVAVTCNLTIHGNIMRGLEF